MQIPIFNYLKLNILGCMCFLIKVSGERTGLHVETGEIKSTWPEGNYDSLMLFWLCYWDILLRGACVSCFTVFQKSHAV